ncbi:MAG: hypothetical protein GY862_23080 [Gammaproteobacteria bacterium]|nr:hypothetical protein [Gammaproteobacteria bacterium]
MNNTQFRMDGLVPMMSRLLRAAGDIVPVARPRCVSPGARMPAPLANCVFCMRIFACQFWVYGALRPGSERTLLG